MDDRFKSSDSCANETPNTARGEKARRIVADVLAARGRGVGFSDAEVLAEHPDLMKELKPQLELANKIRQARLAAERNAFQQEELQPITESQFDALLKDDPDTDQDFSAIEHAMPRLPGYFIHHEIDHGGQGAVYRATQESTARVVAVKVMSGGAFANSRHRARFDREAKILSILDHPNIVSIIDRGRTVDGSFYFVMQFVDGLALDDYWKAHCPSTEEGTRQLVRLIAKIAYAVEIAHANHVVHRDLKPSNIRVDGRGEPHILDFGLARPLTAKGFASGATITSPGQIIGSLPWASPEQAAGRTTDLDQRSDVYSLGVLLFQAMTGQFPYSLEGPIDQVLLRIRTARVQPCSKQPGVRPGVDHSLDTIVLKALEKFEAGRYGSAGGLANDLQAWLNGRAIQARDRNKRRIGVMQLAATGALVVVASLAGWAWRASRPMSPEVFAMPTLMNSIGMKMIELPAGGFDMGSPETEAGHDRNETRKHVSIRNSFFIGATEVTQSQYKEVMHRNPSDARWLGASMPVGGVSWSEAVEFCKRLSEAEHCRYRLPTDVEWEYACRAMSTEPFQDLKRPARTIWYSEDSENSLHPVGQKAPNAWGLFDMQGNVAEWCQSADSGLGPAAENAQPEQPVRGGSALSDITDCRASSQQLSNEHLTSADLGFRIARDP